MSVAQFSLKRPVTTTMFFVSMVVIGLIAAFRLPLEAMPDVSAPFIDVNVPYAGSTPAEVERTILRPTEEALATMSGIKHMNSSATASGANVFIEFSDWSRDIAITASQARQRMDGIRDQLPSDVQRYFVEKFSTSDQPVLQVRMAGAKDLSNEYALIDREFKRPIERLPGVAKVDISGAVPDEVEIAVDPDRLTAHGVNLNDLATKLRAVNFSVSAGEITDGSQRLRVQPVGEIASLDQLRNLVIGSNGLRLGDIASVHLQPQRITFGRRLNGKPAVGIDIYKERNANLVDVTRRAMAMVNEIRAKPSLGGIRINVIGDSGKDVTSSLMDLAEAGLIGLALSVAVLFFFLRDWVSTAMVTLAIPICFTITLGLMYFFGVTLNILSLMGLLLAVGMLVDNAVVVVESIYQERERMPDDPRRASIVGTRNVAIALSAGTLCHCIVFAPNLFGERNFMSIYLSQIAITISASLLASWLVAVSLIPMISARLRTPPTVRAHDGFIPRLQRGYERLLRWTLEHRGWSVAGIAFIIAVSCIPMAMVKTDLMAQEQVGKTQIFYHWKGSYTREQMSDEVRRVEGYLEANRKRFHITQIYSYFSEEGFASTMLNLDATTAAKTAPLVDAIRKNLPKSARADLGIGDMGGPGGGGGGGGSDQQGIQLQLVGDSSQVLMQQGAQVVPVLARLPDASGKALLHDVRIDNGDQNSELNVRVDRDRAAAFGFSAQDVAGFIGIALRGTPLHAFRRGDDEVPVTVRFAGSQNYGEGDLKRFTVSTPDGRKVPLLALVDVSSRPAASQIQRTDRQTTLTIKASLADKVTAPDARKAMEKALSGMRFPDGYSYTFDGSFQQGDEAGAQMGRNLLIALALIYIVMAAIFESLLFPAAILSGVLFSVFGVYWLFWITGTTFTIMSFIGILVLMGVVVNNGIVLVEHINNHRRSGMGRTEALVAGSRERLRPILMTMGTAILAMVPLAMGNAQIAGNGPPYYPMARAIAGGLAFSTIVTLLFLPTIYAILDDTRNACVRLIRRARGVDASPAPMVVVALAPRHG
ncbi:MAG: efflux RND transporter permease subunit [Proteobacteria bacterium]|nr:efflux RND transporter permease subunit [Pseudomonadota bacterium]